MRVQPKDFGTMRDWFAVVAQKVFPPQLVANAHPVAQLDQLAERSLPKACDGLSMAISDLIELTSNWSSQDVHLLDAELVKEGLPTLPQMRVRFSKAVGRAVRRGRINDEVEYHAVRNAAELEEGSDEHLWNLLAAYEESAAR